MRQRLIWKFLGLPLLIGVVVHLIASAIPLIGEAGLDKLRDHLTSGEHISVALIATLSVVVLELWISFHRDFGTLYRLHETLDEFEIPTRKYALRRLSDGIRAVSLQIAQLRTDGLRDRTLREKIEIIQEIIEDVLPVNTYWATTLDRPSDLWPLNRFWELQADLLASTQSKRRMVIIDRVVLRDEISDHHEVLRDFITWHMKQKFELLFLIDEGDTFGAEADQFLEKLSAQEVVTDFAIINDTYVYGEVKQKTSVQPEREEHVRLLRLYGPESLGEFIVGDYIQLYNQLWRKWRGYKWHVMSPQQVLSECSRQKAKKELLSDTKVYYSGLGIRLNPPDCYEDARASIASATKRVIAVDIAPLKSNLLDWTLKPAYARWQEATCQAATRAKCSRVYILSERMENLGDRQVVLKNILEPQRRAGVEIAVASAEDLRLRGIPVHDFILVDRTLVLSLGWDEAFTADSVSVEKNLEHPRVFEWYSNIFSNILANDGVRHLAHLNDEQLLEYLQTLGPV